MTHRALVFFVGCLDEQTASATAAVGDPATQEAACGPNHPPPPEALDACASSTAGAKCSFDIDEHHVEGTCRSPSADVPLACAPDMLPPK